jgi:hypothetical protein
LPLVRYRTTSFAISPKFLDRSGDVGLAAVELQQQLRFRQREFRAIVATAHLRSGIEQLDARHIAPAPACLSLFDQDVRRGPIASNCAFCSSFSVA